MKWYKRKILKAIVYRIISMTVTFLGALITTQELVAATGAMLVIEFFHFLIYVAFELGWHPVKHKWLKTAQDAFFRIGDAYYNTLIWRCDECGVTNISIRDEELKKCKHCGASPYTPKKKGVV